MSLLEAHEKGPPREPNFILEVIRFPFTKSGFPILVMGMILMIASSFAAIIPVLGLFSYLFIFAYLCGLYFALIDLSASGEDEIYCFPDISDPIDDIAKPGLHVLGVFLISFAPLLVILFTLEGEGPNTLAYVIGGILWAAFYFPMAMLATVLFSSIRGALPHIVFPAIFKAGPFYLIAFGLTLGLAAMSVFGSFEKPPSSFPMIILTQVLSAFLSMFILMASARTLGLLYYRREEEIGWF